MTNSSPRPRENEQQTAAINYLRDRFYYRLASTFSLSSASLCDESARGHGTSLNRNAEQRQNPLQHRRDADPYHEQLEQLRQSTITSKLVYCAKTDGAPMTTIIKTPIKTEIITISFAILPWLSDDANLR